MRQHIILSCFLLACLPLPALAHDCAELARLTLPRAHIDAARNVAAGAFLPPNLEPGQVAPDTFRKAPAFCRVQASLKPTAQSDIQVEVWLPESGWNGRFRGIGNGGFAGYIDYEGLAAALDQGYASASTDTGHRGGDAAWALGAPQKVVDFGYRAVHEMTAFAKTVVHVRYHKPAARAYFSACSNGGRQALMEAQRFPSDYDGIIAGAPAANWTHLLANGLGVTQQATTPTGYIPPAKLASVTRAVLDACDAKDGVDDGILGDPRQCRFDPADLLCRDAGTDSCLTAPQVETLRTIYHGVHDHDGKRIFPGLMPGAESYHGAWERWITGKQPGKSAFAFFAGNYFGNMVYDQRDWQINNANIDTALALATRKTASTLNAVDADIRPFVAHGGKLILYHGWNDPAIAPMATVAYFDAVTKSLGPEASANAVRLYMVPGMLHCAGGPGPNDFGQYDGATQGDAGHDILATLVRWVEHDVAPTAIIAAKHVDDAPAKPVLMTRPLCPWPQFARYDGHGDSNDASSFACVTPPPAGNN